MTRCTTTTKSNETARRIICMLCQQTSPKRWFANMNITSNCTVTNSVYTVPIGTLRHCSKQEFGRGHKTKQLIRASSDLCTPQGWLRTWPRWPFTNPLWSNMLEHDYWAAKPEISVVFIFSSTWNEFVIFDVIVSSLAAFVLFRDLSHKDAWINHNIPVT